MPETPIYDAVVTERGWDPLRDWRIRKLQSTFDQVQREADEYDALRELEDEEPWQPPTYPEADPVRWNSGA